MTEQLVLSTGEAVLFWVLAPLMVLGALALLFARRPVHIAVSIAGVMVALAVLYIALEAPFLGVAQVVVYTGAVMMLFLFVIMLVGVDSTESLTETLAGQRWIAVVGGLGLVALMIAIVTRATFGSPVGLEAANADTNPVGVARLIFGDYVFPFELTAALLITAALGALVLSHRRRLGPKRGQRETVEKKLATFAESGSATAVVSAPGPGVYARTNSADMPALAATGETLDASVTTVLRVRGQVLRDEEAAAQTGRVAMIASGLPMLDTTDEAQLEAETPETDGTATESEGATGTEPAERGHADQDEAGTLLPETDEGDER
ncbi:NADH-quinone oxidoreductase subunit J [Ruania alkalisoli]|uniref:NADH-quinone oxidoreductase subunit J n=1 Tax=Ruania alkalisoli TaxID=2779775 RepID=A0A7M1SR08_9MICO|nr:NADH-quinone oxidoreductase subunit J [Ruania alkalisoli]QOR70019.1 NADH-quinone oxidoreductase subunit J [Ruania alkalisoli]